MSKQARKEYTKIMSKKKRKIARRLKRKQWEEQERPMFTAKNIHYEIAEKGQAIACGGIGAIHQMVIRSGLVKEIDENLELLKTHVPYHESDHILNITYNVLSGNVRLEDIELHRQDSGYLDALGAQRIPDPTTAGDFTRRFDREDIVKLMDRVNTVRERVWEEGRKEALEEALIDVDGTIAGTYGECKAGMDMSYKGIWGYTPLIVSLANTREVLYIENRPGNVPSHSGAVAWIDKAIGLVKPHAKRVCLRGDTDFSLTGNFDRWSEQVDFVFGMDARSGLIKRAGELPEGVWEKLNRKPKYQVKTEERQKPENVKEQIIREREYKNLRLESEYVAEFEYQPEKCAESYRMIVLRKNLSVEKGQRRLFDDI